jgi:DNA-binding CsgD family transcriptional regulator
VSGSGASPRLVVGVDGTGRTHALDMIARDRGDRVLRVAGRLATDLAAGEAADDLATADPTCLVVLDDAHAAHPRVLEAVHGAARRGAEIALSRRPGVPGDLPGRLEDLALARGATLTLGALDARAVGRLLARAGRPQSDPHPLLADSGGAAWLVAALVAGADPVALQPAVERRVARLPETARRSLWLLAMAGDLGPDVEAADVAAAAEAAGLADPGGGGPGPEVPPVRALWLAGLLDLRAREAGRDAVAPAVAAALRAGMTGPERRRLLGELVRALHAAGAPADTLAVGYEAAGIRSPEARAALVAAARRRIAGDPAAAARWFAAAADPGDDPRDDDPGPAVARALAGLPPLPDDLARPAVAAHDAARDGRLGRAVGLLLGSADAGERLAAAPGLLALGRGRELRALAGSPDAPGPPGVARLLAVATVAVLEGPPEDAAARFVEACEAALRESPAVVLPDSPAAVACPVLVAAADSRGALRLLDQALAAGSGGPAAADRLRLLAHWARLRSGRTEEAPAGPLPGAGRGRDRALAAALRAGAARRRGDVVALRACWDEVDAVLARRAADLLAGEALEELVVAAVRLGDRARAGPVQADLEAMAADAPALARAALAWTRLQAAAVSDDPAAAEHAAADLATVAATAGAGRRQRAQAAAAAVWSRVLAADVDPEAVLTAVDDLSSVELPWEAGRLAGQSAVRVTAPAAARRLLEKARDLSARPPGGPVGGAEAGRAPDAGLTERELEIGRLVLTGRTHREIGTQLYISPKTVEHHVARIRAKLGARTRAEFLAALRSAVTAGSAAAGAL